MIRPTTHDVAAGAAAVLLCAVLFAHTVALRLVSLAVGLGLLAFVVFRDRKGLSLLPPVWLPFLLFAAWALASLAWSIDAARSAKEFRNEIVYSGLTLWLCYVAAQARLAPRILLPALWLGAATACVIALYTFGRGLDAYMRGWHGSFGNHSAALITLMPCVIMAGWYAKRSGWPSWTRRTCGVLAVLIVIGAYTTLNRTIWLAFVAQALIVGVLLARRRARLSLALVVTAVVFCVGAMLFVQAKREAAGMALTVKKDPRLELWPEVIELIEAKPLTGYGFGRGLLRAELKDEFNDGLLWHAHNLFLDTTLQIGLPGLLLLLLLLGALAREGWGMTRAGGDAAVACGIALLAVLAGMLLRNMTDMLFVRQNALLFWGVCGVLLAWGRRRPA